MFSRMISLLILLSCGCLNSADLKKILDEQMRTDEQDELQHELEQRYLLSEGLPSDSFSAASPRQTPTSVRTVSSVSPQSDECDPEQVAGLGNRGEKEESGIVRFFKNIFR